MNALGGLRRLASATPFFYIGDSHAGAIGRHVFEASDGSLVCTVTENIWRFVAADVTDADGAIGPELTQALRCTGALHSSPTFPHLPGLPPVRVTHGAQKCVEQLAVTESAAERPYVLSVGEINTRYLVERLAADEIDFDVPFAIDGLERLGAFSARQTLRSDQMMRLLVTEFSPIFRGLRLLRDAGMRTLFLHSVPPPTIDDGDSLRVLHHRSPALLRYKLVMYVNYLYDAVCRDLGVGFVNTWPKVTEGNLLRQEFYLDGLHLNYAHSELSVNEVHRMMSARGAPAPETTP